MTQQNKQGPFYAAFQGETIGVIKQELITYRIRDGVLVKETVSRDYSKSDYQDSISITPLAEVKNENTK
jgi:hypothetical protein